ncbi:MAG: hypothetical protein EXR86_02040 [Gammaproteobacteria bacterium]|nr:hypothetical protein [Gammaproteobacteria bacterium]
MNPEFQRQCWLELSVARVTLMGGSLAALFMLMAFIDAETGTGVALPAVAAATFVALSLAWGGQRAGDAMLVELRDRTWDTQRLSALGSWRMVWGKWLGATSLTWLSGGVCLAVFMLSAKQFEFSIRALLGIQAVTGAVFVQGLSLIGALASAGHPKRNKGPVGARLIAVIGGLVFAYFAFRLGDDELVRWYGRDYPALSFTTCLVVATTAWVVVGAYRMMCNELQVRAMPWLWLIFLLYVSAVITGFFSAGIGTLTNLRTTAVSGLLCTVLAAYLCAFTLFRDPLALRRLVRYGRDGEWRRFGEAVPLWLCSLALSVMWVAISMALSGGVIAPQKPVENLGFVGVPLLLFVIRDLLILLAASNFARPDRAEMTTALTLGLLYWLAPALFEMLGLETVSQLLRPAFWTDPVSASVLLLIQIALCTAWAYRLYRIRAAPRTAATA